jgi:hypothetical protein
MRTAVERILDCDFEQIIVGHGAVVESTASFLFGMQRPEMRVEPMSSYCCFLLLITISHQLS